VNSKEHLASKPRLLLTLKADIPFPEEETDKVQLTVWFPSRLDVVMALKEAALQWDHHGNLFVDESSDEESRLKPY